jgi:hypothetical protein
VGWDTGSVDKRKRSAGEFCDEKFDALKKLFIKNEIHYGVSDTNKNEQLENLLNQLQEHHDNTIILTSIANKN